MSATSTVQGAADRRLLCAALPAPTLPGELRARLDLRLDALGTERLTRDVRDGLALAVSELVTNACQATPEHLITFWAEIQPTSVWIGVWDNDDQCPRLEASSPDLDTAPDPFALDDGYDCPGTGGRGLQLVSAVADGCGVHPTPPHGKWVYATFRF